MKKSSSALVAVTAFAVLASVSFGSSAPNLAAARKAIAPYTGHPSPFPVTEPLGKRLPAGKKFVYLQCATPICALFGTLVKPAVAALRGKLTVINSGSSASTLQAASGSALAIKPAAVLIPAYNPADFGPALKKFKQANIKTTSVGVINGKKYGIDYGVGGLASIQLAGRLLADWVIVNKGPKANVVFYNVPELDFTAPMQAAFKAELAKNCPSCTFRAAPISVVTIGNSAPQAVVNDIRSHSGTNTAVFATEEAATGLPAALKVAGLTPTTVGFAPSPVNLQDIKDGKLTAGLGLDVPVQQWTQVDAAARLILGEKIPPTEGNIPLEFLTKKQITFDPSKGWTGYPDFAKRFVKLWAGK
jgi:ribose transport system substrate-binding protein